MMRLGASPGGQRANSGERQQVEGRITQRRHDVWSPSRANGRGILAQRDVLVAVEQVLD